MRESGGCLFIGDFVHSGTNCLVITRNHNYDTGHAIPYDETFEYKDVVIGDFVWDWLECYNFTWNNNR